LEAVGAALFSGSDHTELATGAATSTPSI
jgi:hypothetical protein